MFESRINQISDQFSRDFNSKATVTYHNSQPVKETYITDTVLPNFKTMNNFGKHMENDIKTLDRKFDRDYNIDYRIHELEKNAEQTYSHWKKAQEKLDEEKRRERSLKDFRDRLEAEKDQLRQTFQAQEQPDQGFQGTMKSGYDYSLAGSGLQFHNSGDSRSPERREFRETGGFEQSHGFRRSGKMNIKELRSSSQGFTKTLKASNDDFNFHQLDMNRTVPGKSFHYHDETINYQNVDVEKLEAASKHCGACEAKYKLILNMVNPYKEKQRITDEAIRKILIQLKGLFMSKRHEEAQDLVESALEDGYRHADIYYMAGEVKRALGLHKEAEAFYLQALTFQVHSPYIYQSLGLTYINLGNHKRAIPLLKHFTDKIVSDSSNFELGKCLAVCKSYLEATVYFGKAIEINSKVGDYYLHRGDSYEALGFMKLAIDDYRAFRNLTPNYKEIFERNIKDLERQGKYEEANSYKVYMRKIMM